MKLFACSIINKDLKKIRRFRAILRAERKIIIRKMVFSLLRLDIHSYNEHYKMLQINKFLMSRANRMYPVSTSKLVWLGGYNG